jgi:hypothetical protein
MIFRRRHRQHRVEANTDRPTDWTILVKLIARIRTTGGNLHRLLEGRADLAPSRRLMGEESLWLIADDLARSAPARFKCRAT